MSSQLETELETTFMEILVGTQSVSFATLLHILFSLG